MLHEMGLETGVDLEKLLGASRAAQELLGRPLGAHLLTAGPVRWNADASRPCARHLALPIAWSNAE